MNKCTCGKTNNNRSCKYHFPMTASQFEESILKQAHEHAMQDEAMATVELSLDQSNTMEVELKKEWDNEERFSILDLDPEIRGISNEIANWWLEKLSQATQEARKETMIKCKDYWYYAGNWHLAECSYILYDQGVCNCPSSRAIIKILITLEGK